MIQNRLNYDVKGLREICTFVRLVFLSTRFGQICIHLHSKFVFVIVFPFLFFMRRSLHLHPFADGDGLFGHGLGVGHMVLHDGLE